jgi:glutathione S-transferase
MIKLYHYPDCPYSQKVRVVMAEKELEYERVLVDLRKNEQRSADFLKLNPYGKVPVLIDEDIVIYDSTVINEYLEEEYPTPSLMPDDSAGRSRVRLLEDFCDNSFIPPTLIILAELARSQGERDNDKIGRFRGELARVLAHLDAQLDGKDFLAGGFSLADCAFAPRMMILPQLGVEVDQRLQNVGTWIARLRERPSVRSLGL